MSRAVARTPSLSLLVVLSLPPILAARLEPAGATEARPNLLLILADDLGYETLGANGGTSYRTPRLDRLAREGMRFTRSCVTPLCTPTRLELMTGRYGYRTGQEWGVLPPGERTFAHVLRAAGYATAVAGKWQLCKFPDEPDHPRRAGFDRHCVWTWRYRGRKLSRYRNPSIWQDGKLLEGVEDRYGPEIFSDYLARFIRAHRDRPFLAYYPMALVHAPFDRPPPPPGREPPAGPPEGPKSGPENFPLMVETMDRLVGKLVDVVDGLGLAERTLVLFIGDNGTPGKITSRLGSREVRGAKGQMRLDGFHVPCIARWKGRVPAGSVRDDLVDGSDFFPTLLAAAGAEVPSDRPIDGHSFLPLLLGGGRSVRDHVYVQLGEKRCVWDGRWLLHAEGRLIDTERDPLEARPRRQGAEPEEAAKARRRLRAALDRHARAAAATVRAPGP